MRGTYRYTRLREAMTVWHSGHTSTWAAQLPQNTCLQRVKTRQRKHKMVKSTRKASETMHVPAVQRCVFRLRHADAARGGVFDAGGGGSARLRLGQLLPRARCAALRVRHYLAAAAQVEIESKT